MVKSSDTVARPRRRRLLTTATRFVTTVVLVLALASATGTAVADHGERPCPGTGAFQEHNQATENAALRGIERSTPAIGNAAQRLQPHVPQCEQYR